jgi:hypothetical protein
MFLETTTRLDLANARHHARVRAATLRHVLADAAADRDWSRRTTRPAVWRRVRRG